MNTYINIEIPDKLFGNYLNSLVGLFYKILPIKESGEPSLGKYMESLQRELIGCRNLISELNYDELYLSLLSILQYLIENDCSTDIVKCEVFKAIRICKKLQKNTLPRRCSCGSMEHLQSTIGS